ncbi:MAG: glycosyltransferase family 2 protein [Chthoniobacterales bacterium]|jgi:glycosyltransferase involved in cell wall biosynthesis
MADLSEPASAGSPCLAPGNPAPPVDRRRCVVIPSYNNGPRLEQTVREVLAVWQPVVVVIDGSTDGSNIAIVHLAAQEPGLHVLAQPHNTGKGAAVFAAFNYAVDRGWTNAVVFDADGQHDAADIPKFMEAAGENPTALVLGQPQYGDDAPLWHIIGHGVANRLARLETLRPGLGDSLFGLRLYPMLAMIKALRRIRGGRRFDFETQAVVRMVWLGVPTMKLPATVRYPKNRVRHFRYLRDNLLLCRVHCWLLLRSVFIWPKLLWRKLTKAPPFDAAKYRG